MDTVRSVWSKLLGSSSIPSSSRATSSDVQPLNAGQKKMFEVMLPLVISTKSLDFGPLTNERSQRTIIITNPNRLDFPPVAWKALTNLQHHYCVRPNMGVLKSGDSVTILLIREAAQRHVDKPPKPRVTPAFLIRNTPILEQWYQIDGRALWKHLTDIQHHLVMSEHRIRADRPGIPSSSSAINGSALASSRRASDNEDSMAELARLRVENALLRAQVFTLSVPAASGSGTGNTEPHNTTSSTNASNRPASEYEWEDAAPSYAEAVAQEPSPRPQ